jgi:hypothetical protein
MFLYRKGGMQYVDRGDAAAYDFNEATLTQDSAWHTLSLSAIVPANAKVVVLRIGASHASAGRYFRVAKVGNTTGFNNANVSTQVASVINEMTTEIALNAAREIIYWATSGTFASLRLLVMGWWI